MKLRKNVLGLAILLCTVSLGFGIASANSIAEESSQEARFEVLGAQVRIIEPSGIRFVTEVNAAYKAELTEKYSTEDYTYVWGTTLTFTDVEGNFWTVDVETKKWIDNDTRWYTALTEVPEIDYLTEITAQSYVKIYTKEDIERATVIEIRETELETRSIAWTASWALNDGYTDDILYEYTKVVETSSVALNKENLSLVEGKEKELTATVFPAGYGVVWTSSDETVATVNKNGTVKAIGVGVATITASFGAANASCQVAVDKDAIGDNEATDFVPVVRFAVASDMHVGAGDKDTALWTETMMEQAYAYAESGADGYSKLDAFFFAGDLTNNGYKTEYETVKTIFDSKVKEGTELVLSLGNHDGWNTGIPVAFEVFKEEGGSSYFQRHLVIGGYHVISIYPDDNPTGKNQYSQEMSNWLENEIQEALADTGKDKPIFIVQHVGERDTVAGTDGDTSDNTGLTGVDCLYEMKSKYSNIVTLTGHTHFPSNDECSILQDTYTSIGTSSLYKSMNYLSRIGKTNITVAERTRLAQSLIIEVDENGRTRIKVYDVAQQRFVGESLLLDSYKPEGFKYTKDRFKDGDIFFADDAEAIFEGIVGNTSTISFPVVPKESLSGRAYEISVYEKDGALVSTEYIADYYYQEIYDRRVFVELENLVSGKEYKVVVTALNSLYLTDLSSETTLRSNSLAVEFAFNAEALTGELVDLEIDALNNIATNKVVGGLEIRMLNGGVDELQEGVPTIAYDNTIHQNVLLMDGSGKGLVRFGSYKNLRSELTDSMTVEMYFKINQAPADGKKEVIMGSMQVGGFGLQVFGNNVSGSNSKYSNKIVFYYHNGEWVPISFDYEVGKYYHIVATYDGRTFKLYVNGESVGAQDMGTLQLTRADTNADYIWLGTDTGWNGKPDTTSASAKCSIAEFKLYNYGLQQEDVNEAYYALKSVGMLVDLEINETDNSV